MKHNIILNTDSYKASHWKQYPPGIEGVFSYIESRGGAYPESLVFGLQAYLKEYLSNPITQEDIDEAEVFWKGHGEPFNKEGWEYILKEHKGKLPVRIKAVPEGTIVPTGNALLTIENTDPKCFWLTSYLETSLLRAVWYPTTVATISWRIKQLIRKYLIDTGAGEEEVLFKLHDFGARGVSSQESAGLGGAAHLVNFLGTDTVEGALTAMRYYNSQDEVPAFSIPAAEHSTITSWGKENEANAYANMLKQYKDNPLIAVVSDSYDIYNAVDKIWGQELKSKVIDHNGFVIIRPDSGNPADVVGKVLQILDERFGSETNDYGYKLLNNVRVIQGDGINELSISQILERAKVLGFSADNLAFGMGGALLQHCDRDTMQWAMKCSAMKINGKWRDVWKKPVTDSGKDSKRGRLILSKMDNDWVTLKENSADEHENYLKTVYENGELKIDETFEKIRQRASRV